METLLDPFKAERLYPKNGVHGGQAKIEMESQAPGPRKELLDATGDLKINGTAEDEREFEDFREQIYGEATEKEILVLADLMRHHPNSLKHCMMVARDTDYIARELRLDDELTDDLRKAALLHDIGKLEIHQGIIDFGGGDLPRRIWEEQYSFTPAPEKISISNITVRDVMRHNAGEIRDSERSAQYVRDFLNWLQERKLEGFLDQSVRAYLNHHQEATRSLLTDCGTRPRVIDFASGHHPSYFPKQERTDLPKECRIIELADKFNAMIQSEGIRHYIGKLNKKTRTEALNIIAQELKVQFEEQSDPGLKELEKNALAVLLKKHLNFEVENEIIPGADEVINSLRQNASVLEKSATDDQVPGIERARKMLVMVPVILSLSKEFGDILEDRLAAKLGETEIMLRSILESLGD